VGTGSPRRIAQLLAARPDLEVVDIRGNVDTRLRFVSEGRLDAVLLAAAGVKRLGRADAVTDTLDLRSWPTAPGQGALALEVRAADLANSEVARAARVLADPGAELTVAAEREVLRGLEAGCTAPVAASSSFSQGVLAVWAAVYRPDGTASVQRQVEQSAAAGDLDPLAAGRRLVDELLDAGAAELAPLGGRA
jgi:hydroxymethylbilane synthase